MPGPGIFSGIKFAYINDNAPMFSLQPFAVGYYISSLNTEFVRPDTVLRLNRQQLYSLENRHSFAIPHRDNPNNTAPDVRVTSITELTLIGMALQAVIVKLISYLSPDC